MHAECRYLEELLDGQAYLAGERPSAAEPIVFPEIRLVPRAMERKPEIMTALDFDRLADRYPRLAAWEERVGVDKTPGDQREARE